MRLPLARLVVAYVGLAVAVYALASLTGAWLGTPPWWIETDRLGSHERDTKEQLSVGVAIVGLMLFALALRPRRWRGSVLTLLISSIPFLLAGPDAWTVVAGILNYPIGSWGGLGWATALATAAVTAASGLRPHAAWCAALALVDSWWLYLGLAWVGRGV